MAIALTSIGIKVSYAFEAVENGGRPTTGYKLIPQVKEIPELDADPASLDATSFDNQEFMSYVDGLKDLGGSLTFTANFTQELVDLWNGTNGVMEQWATAKAANRQMFICVDIPGLNESCFLSVIPSKLGMPGASVNSVMDASLRFTPVGEPEWANDPTYDEPTTNTTTENNTQE